MKKVISKSTAASIAERWGDMREPEPFVRPFEEWCARANAYAPGRCPRCGGWTMAKYYPTSTTGDCGIVEQCQSGCRSWEQILEGGYMGVPNVV